MIGAVYLAVATQAVLAKNILVGTTTGKIVTAIGYAGVKGGCVALLTLGRAPRREQTFVD